MIFKHQSNLRSNTSCWAAYTLINNEVPRGSGFGNGNGRGGIYSFAVKYRSINLVFFSFDVFSKLSQSTSFCHRHASLDSRTCLHVSNTESSLSRNKREIFLSLFSHIKQWCVVSPLAVVSLWGALCRLLQANAAVDPWPRSTPGRYGAGGQGTARSQWGRHDEVQGSPS